MAAAPRRVPLAHQRPLPGKAAIPCSEASGPKSRAGKAQHASGTKYTRLRGTRSRGMVLQFLLSRNG